MNSQKNSDPKAMKKNEENKTNEKGKEDLHSARLVQRAWPCKPESLFPSRSTLLQERETNAQNTREFVVEVDRKTKRNGEKIGKLWEEEMLFIYKYV